MWKKNIFLYIHIVNMLGDNAWQSAAVKVNFKKRMYEAMILHICEFFHVKVKSC